MYSVYIDVQRCQNWRTLRHSLAGQSDTGTGDTRDKIQSEIGCETFTLHYSQTPNVICNLFTALYLWYRSPLGTVSKQWLHSVDCSQINVMVMWWYKQRFKAGSWDEIKMLPNFTCCPMSKEDFHAAFMLILILFNKNYCYIRLSPAVSILQEPWSWICPLWKAPKIATAIVELCAR